METNRERLERLGIMDDETIEEISREIRCVICDKYVEKNLSPTNPACEGAWCDEAIEYWLDEEYEEVGEE